MIFIVVLASLRGIHLFEKSNMFLITCCVLHDDCSIVQSSDENVNVLYHPPDHKGPILFSYREKVFFGKKRASLQVENGEWSDKFSLDAAGSTGVVECKADGVKYDVRSLHIYYFYRLSSLRSSINRLTASAQIAVHNTLTHNSLTKQITFMPFYVLLNKAPFTIQVQDDKRPGDRWLNVEPEECAPLWPKSDSRTLHVRVKDNQTISRPFKFTDVQCSLLKMKNRVIFFLYNFEFSKH